jgi:Na+/H+ antiporter NhaA
MDEIWILFYFFFLLSNDINKYVDDGLENLFYVEIEIYLKRDMLNGLTTTSKIFFCFQF